MMTADRRSWRAALAAACALFLIAASSARAADLQPELSSSGDDQAAAAADSSDETAAAVDSNGETAAAADNNDETAAAVGVETGKTGVEWVTIPGGKFIMGADDLGPKAQPRHEVTIQSFQMAKTLVTNSQYKACVADRGCTPAHVSDSKCWVRSWSQGNPFGKLPDSFQGDDQPVVCVSRVQTLDFSRWAAWEPGQIRSRGRLPTEAEWEYAARSGGKDQKYPWGDEAATCSLAVMKGCGSATAPVCSKPAGNTSQGLCDMAGNVLELVQDPFHDSYGAPSDGRAWENKDADWVGRGGSLFSDAKDIRSARRLDIFLGKSMGGSPNGTSILGFRPARPMPTNPPVR